MAQRARRAADRELDRVDPCGINGFESVEQDDESGQALHWRIVELRDTRAMIVITAIIWMKLRPLIVCPPLTRNTCSPPETPIIQQP